MTDKTTIVPTLDYKKMLDSMTAASTWMRQHETSISDIAAFLSVAIDEANDIATILNHAAPGNTDLRHIRFMLDLCQSQARSLSLYMLGPDDPTDLRTLSVRLPADVFALLKSNAGTNYGALQRYVTRLIRNAPRAPR